MASLCHDAGGKKRILFVDKYGKRRKLSLGKVNERSAKSILTHVEPLIVAARSRTPWDPETAEWVGKLDDVRFYNRLAALELVPPREPKGETEKATLGPFLEQYIKGRTDLKDRTRNNLGQVKQFLVEHFGAKKPLEEISAGDADAFRLFLQERLSDNTVRRHCGRCKQLFRAAVRKRLIAENPFGDMKGCGCKINASRFYFVSRDEAKLVLDACPDAQWRLLFALARYGGLRVPSEPLALRWSDVDWARGRITVWSPKTEHHEGRECRQIPLFPELRPYLEAAWDEAEPGTEHVITRYRDTNSNLRTQFNRIVQKAGLKPWPKPFQNCRSSRETELAAQHPIHVACAWIGNTQAVAAKHYLQVRDEDFERAAIEPPKPEGAESGALRAQNQAQPPSDTIGCQRPAKQNPLEEQGLCRVVSQDGLSCPPAGVPWIGFEPTTYGLGNRCSIP